MNRISSFFMIFAILITHKVVSCREDRAEFGSLPNPKENLSFYEKANTEGIQLFCELLYEEALEKFNATIQDYSKNKVSNFEMGTALWGKILCNAALDRMDDFFNDVRDIEYFFLDYHKCPYSEADAKPRVLLAANCSQWFDRPIGQIAPNPPVQFANPNEKVSIQECIDRVQGTADVLRAGVVCLKKREVIWILNNLIGKIEAACIRCCNTGAFWTECLSPIIEKLNKWKIYGIPNDPAWD